MGTASASRARGPRVAHAAAIAVAALALGLAALTVGVATHARSFALAELSRRIGRPVHVDGEFSARPALDSLTIRFAGLHVDQAAWAGPGAVLKVQRGVVVLPWTALLGDVRVQDLQLDGLTLDLRRDLQGRVNWLDGPRHRAARLPRIARIILRGSWLSYQDVSRALTFQGAVAVASSAAGPPILTIKGGGRAEDGVWSLDARSTTDFAGSAPYLLSGRLVVDKPSGRSAAQFDGRFTPAGQRLEARLESAGPDLHDLSHLINVPLPHTPPYHLHARVDRTPEATRLQDLSGRIGASDLAGALTITPAPGSRRLDGMLRSRSLRMSDLLSVASGGQLTRARRQGRLLPDTPFNPIPLRKLTGAIRLSAASVQSPAIRSLRLLATFDHGRIAAAPLALSLAHGRAVIGFVLDLRRPIPQVRLNADLKHADTLDFRSGGPLQAEFDGAIHLQGAGLSLSAAAAHAAGDIRFSARRGRLQKTRAAVLSGHLVQGVTSLVSGSRADIPLQCAVARFEVRDGQARATALHLATGLGGVTGSGGFKLASETIDLTLQPASSPMTGVTSVRIVGPLTHPTATLSLSNPVRVVGHILGGLFHPVAPRHPLFGCG